MQTPTHSGAALGNAQKPTVALALGGGGARGIAHILMLEVFDELGIRPTLIAGTSIGALYGAAYASGLTAAQIRAYTDETLAHRFDLVRQLFAARSEPVQKLLKLLPVRTSLLNPATLLDLVFPGQVAKDFADGEAVGVQGTPMFFINGRVVAGAQPFPVFKKIIDEELAR